MSRHFSPHPYNSYEDLWDAQYAYQRRRAVRRVSSVLFLFLFFGAVLTGLWAPVIVLGALTMGGSCLGAFVRGIIALLIYNTKRLGNVFRHHSGAKVVTLAALLLALGQTGCASQMYGLSCAMGYQPVTIEGKALCREARR
jgi:hypothetical protein